MDNIEELSNNSPDSCGSLPDRFALLPNVRIPKHQKGVPVARGGGHPFGIRAYRRPGILARAIRRQYFSMMSGEAMYTMIWSVPSAIWLPRQSCHSWLTRAPSV